MSALPLVSVIVLSHRFDLAIDAMRSVKTQSYPQERIELRLHHRLDYTPAKFNDAYAGCRGTYFVFLPDDDTLGPEFVTRTVEVAERDTADAVITDHYVTGRMTLKWHLPMFDAEVLRMSAVPWMTFLIRADCFRALPEGLDGQTGGWDGALAYSDWDVGIRLAKYGKRVTQLRGEYLWNRSEHPASASFGITPEGHAASLRQLRQKHSAMVQHDANPHP